MQEGKYFWESIFCHFGLKYLLRKQLYNVLYFSFSFFIKLLLYLGHRENLIVYHPETLEALFNNSKDLIAKGWHYRPLEPWLSQGLLTSSGQKWQSRRKLLTPAFHFNILADALSIFNSKVCIKM